MKRVLIVTGNNEIHRLMNKAATKIKDCALFIGLVESGGKTRRYSAAVVFEDGSGKANVQATRSFGRIRGDEALLSGIELGLDLAIQLQKLGVVLYVDDSRALLWLEDAETRGAKKNNFSPELRDSVNRVKIKWNSFISRRIVVNEADKLSLARELAKEANKKG